MARTRRLSRKTHFLGAKIRGLRKRQGLTLEDLSLRCTQVDPRGAPSVSYLSLIETGKRIPSQKTLALIADVFQKQPDWFLDENIEVESLPPPKEGGGIDGIQLEPAFLFSKELMEKAIPEMLSQTGTSGRQFAQILIRSYQERHQNQFPDLERAAEDVGRKAFPLGVAALEKLCAAQGLEIRWFDRSPFTTRDDAGREIKTLFRSFFEPPGRVFVNRQLAKEPARLKYDLACHLGHKVLHDGDGHKSIHATGGTVGGSPRPVSHETHRLNQEDILYAWRDFECSFFAGALLCPRLPFRHFLIRHAYDVFSGRHIDLTPAVVMRRMTSVSPYRHWHYFDAYPPGYLRAVYRGNGIPLPWGNMRRAADPCMQWSVFRLLQTPRVRRPLAQLALLIDEDSSRLYSSISLRTRDAVGTTHVISAGIDLAPALHSRDVDSADLIGELEGVCQAKGGEAPLPSAAREELAQLARVLNISWIDDALDVPVRITCPRSGECPRRPPCEGRKSLRRAIGWLDEVKADVLGEDAGT